MTKIVLGAGSHPYLADHEIAGTPVVPVAMVLEWFAAAAAKWAGCPDPLVLHGIDVLRKITLTNFHQHGDSYVLHDAASESTLSLKLLGANGIPHFRASVTRDGGRPDEVAWRIPPGLRPPARSSTYDGHVLFHGPAFQSIKRLHGVAPTGAVGVVIGAAELGWPAGGWHTDPAAIDGGLQLAVLWAEQIIGGASLPMSIGTFRVHWPGLLAGPVRCVVRGRQTGSLATECDIGFLGPGNVPRMELLGVRLFLRPDGPVQ